jgi:ankyrin repeat protein
MHLQEKSQMAKKKPALITKSSIDIRNDKGESLIHQAVKKGDMTRVKQLIDDGLSVNTVDNNSWTPLHEV